MKNEKTEISIPFNVSCKPGTHTKNRDQIDHITTQSGINNLSLSWMRPSDEVIYYEIYFFNGTNQINKHIQNAQNNSFFISNLKEKTWYQICIATIDLMWKTGRFVCNQLLTDFSGTSLVTNVLVESESNKIFISWSHPQYKHDIPQGYVVYLKGPYNFCHTFIIKMMEIDIPKDKKCLNQSTTFWSSLKTLEIKDLDPYSEFQIEIIPFNRNKTFSKKFLSIKTKEGESDPVENLKLDKASSEYLYIKFDNPIKSYGKILGYRIKITSTKIDICGKRDAFHYEKDWNKHSDWIDLNILKHCGLYLIKMTPVNRWNQNGGLGKSASIPYEHFIGNTGTMKLNASIISSNMVMIDLEVGTIENQCLINEIVLSIINENNKTDCMTRIMAHDNCDELTKNVQRSYGCPNIQFVKYEINPKRIKLVDDQYISFKISFSRNFNNQNKYKIGASRIYHKIENVTFLKVTLDDKVEDCFTDCFNPGQFYSGIRSAAKTGKICEDWSKTKYKSFRSNICHVSSSNPWCYTGKLWDHCSIPKCSSIYFGTGCVKHHRIVEDINSVFISWSPPDQAGSIIGYLTLLHNTNHSCEQYHLQLCDHCISENQLDNSIKSFYLSCKSRQQIFFSLVAHFRNLHQNRRFIVYIIPIISESKSGEIKNLTIQTSLAKPDVPNISIKSQSFSEIELSWEKQKETKEHGAASKYLLNITKAHEENKTGMRIDKEKIKVEHLEMCSEYCFSLSGINDAGYSEFSKQICSQTLAPKPGIVKLEDLKSGYLTNQEVRWIYSGSDECLKTYRVEYWQKFKENRRHISTNGSSAELKNLKRNAIYVVRVRAEGLMKTLNNENIGDYSLEKQFYTGDTRLELSCYHECREDSFKSLNISWKIKEQMRGSIFEFMILLKNSSKMCQNIILMTCDSCDEPKNQMYLTEEQKDKRLELLKCKPVDHEAFQIENITFYYLMKFKNLISNFSIEIYGTNLMGMHLLNNKSIIIDIEVSSKVNIFIMITTIIVFLSFVILLLVYLKKRQKVVKILQSFHEGKDNSNAIVLENIRKTNAGVSPVKTLICIDRIKNELIKGNQETNIYENVLELGQDKSSMVQRQINYFLKKFVKKQENRDFTYESLLNEDELHDE